MVAEFFREYGLALVVGIEVYVEGVDGACPVVIDHDATRLGSIRPPIRIRPHTFHPRWVFGDIVVGAQEHVFSAMRIQYFQIIQCQWRRAVWYRAALVRWVGVLQLRFDV